MSTSTASNASAEPGLTPFSLGSRTFTSRLIVGTGKYSDRSVMKQALDASGAEVVTVAVRRERLFNERGESLLDFIDTDRYTILPNTAGCFTAEDAVRVSRLGRELLEQLGNPGASWVKLEVLGDKKTLLPDPVGTIEACRELVADGFEVLCYTSDDPISAQRLKEAGATSVMPAGSPIGSGQGVLNRNNIRLCLDLLKGGEAAIDSKPGDRPREGPGDDGARDAQGLRSRTPELPRRPHRQATVRHGELALGGCDQLHPGGVTNFVPRGRPELDFVREPEHKAFLKFDSLPSNLLETDLVGVEHFEIIDRQF